MASSKKGLADAALSEEGLAQDALEDEGPEGEEALIAMDEEAVEDLPDPTAFYYARHGTFLLVVPDPRRPKKEIQEALIAALREDSRVERAAAKPLSDDWSYFREMYPSRRHVHTPELLSGNDAFSSLLMNNSIKFEIHVPKKNQPKFKNIDDVPTDHYWAVWDGCTAIILWQSSEDEDMPARSGGHIVLDVLKEAATRAGCSLEQQACSPACTNLFSHRVLRVYQYPEDCPVGGFHASGFPVVETAVAVDGGPGEVLLRLAPEMLSSGERFATFKNYARRALDIEDRARELVSDLLELDYQSIVESRSNVFVRAFRFLYRLVRRPKITSRELIASLWLAMSGIEMVARDANGRKRAFLETISSGGLENLYDIDRKDDEEDLNSLNLDFIRAAVEQKSRGIDTKLIAMVTASGAVAAVVAAVVGAIVGGLFVHSGH